MNISRVTTLLAILIFAAGCSKLGADKFTVDNASNSKTLNVAVYASESDYINGANSIASGRAGAGGSFSFPASKLSKGTTYYVDAYSDDYYFTNWTFNFHSIIGQENATPRTITYNGGNTFHIPYLGVDSSNARICLMNKTAGTTHWHAVNALDLSDGSSIWSSLPQSERYAAITIKKNSTGTFSYISGADTLSTNFSFGDIVGYPVFSALPNETNLLFFMANTSVNPALFGYQPPTTNTVVSLINGNLYVMERE